MPKVDITKLDNSEPQFNTVSLPNFHYDTITR